MGLPAHFAARRTGEAGIFPLLFYKQGKTLFIYLFLIIFYQKIKFLFAKALILLYDYV